VTFDHWPEPGIAIHHAFQFRTEPEDLVRILGEAARLLVTSRQPVLYAGGGCNTPETSAAITRLLEVIPMPSVTSLMGIGTIADGTPGYLGMIGMHGSGAANRAMHDSDAVLACGVRFDDRATGLIRKFCPDAKIIHIDIDAAEVNKIIPATLSVIVRIRNRRYPPRAR
jgi:acetolactate synthase-1/2/3 large subunit